MGMPKNSPYFKFFKHSVNQMKERGILQVMDQRWIRQIENCPVTPVRPISMEQIFTLFFVIVLGLVLTILAFLLELLSLACRSRKNVRKTDVNESLLDDIADEIQQAELDLTNVDIPGQDILADRRKLLMDLEKLSEITTHLRL